MSSYTDIGESYQNGDSLELSIKSEPESMVSAKSEVESEEDIPLVQINKNLIEFFLSALLTYTYVHLMWLDLDEALLQAPMYLNYSSFQKKSFSFSYSVTFNY